MRIIAGRNRGLRLAAVGRGDRAAHLRPTTDRVREAIFSVLEGGRIGAAIAQARVLDLFAGTGAMGLEALSRGAAQATFVETGRAALGLLEENIRRCRAEAEARILRVDATRLPTADGPAATLVFCDPPWGKGLAPRALERARAGGWLAHGAVVVVEEAAPLPAPEGFALCEHRRWGDAHVTFLTHSGAC